MRFDDGDWCVGDEGVRTGLLHRRPYSPSSPQMRRRDDVGTRESKGVFFAGGAPPRFDYFLLFIRCYISNQMRVITSGQRTRMRL